MGSPGSEASDAAFEAIVARLDYPMFVVTTRAGDRRAGCLVGFASQTSIHPRRFLVGLSKRNHTLRVALDAEGLIVHLVDRRHRELAELFGGRTGDQVDKFTLCEWSDGPFGIPVLNDAAAWFAGRIIDRFELGDHVGFMLEPVGGFAPDGLDEVVSFSDVRDLEPGHEP
jgi:flavin reductase (DIM6/NTAB) family NADH-FMN oxidoreductase RutF